MSSRGNDALKRGTNPKFVHLELAIGRDTKVLDVSAKADIGFYGVRFGRSASQIRIYKEARGRGSRSKVQAHHEQGRRARDRRHARSEAPAALIVFYHPICGNIGVIRASNEEPSCGRSSASSHQKTAVACGIIRLHDPAEPERGAGCPERHGDVAVEDRKSSGTCDHMITGVGYPVCGQVPTDDRVTRTTPTAIPTDAARHSGQWLPG